MLATGIACSGKRAYRLCANAFVPDLKKPDSVNTDSQHLAQAVVTGFCPVFIIVESATQGLVTGGLIALTLWMSAALIGMARKLIGLDVRMLFMTIICATLAAALAVLLAAHVYGLYLLIGVYLPLVAINSFVFTRKQEIYFKSTLLESLKDGAIVTVVVIAVFGLFGLVREVLIHASVFRQFDFDLGQFKPNTGLVLFDYFNGVALFEKSAGALFILAVLMAAFNCIATSRHPTKTES